MKPQAPLHEACLTQYSLSNSTLVHHWFRPGLRECSFSRFKFLAPRERTRRSSATCSAPGGSRGAAAALGIATAVIGVPSGLRSVSVPAGVSVGVGGTSVGCCDGSLGLRGLRRRCKLACLAPVRRKLGRAQGLAAVVLYCRAKPRDPLFGVLLAGLRALDKPGQHTNVYGLVWFLESEAELGSRSRCP